MKKSILLFVLIFTYLSFAQIINVPSEQPTIQAGIDSAVNGDTVLVAEGTYLENINFKGKAITVASRFILNQDTSHISKTIIDGSQPSDPTKGSVVTFNSGEDTNSVLCGFTITGGSGTGPDHFKGGGIFVDNSGANITNNIIRDNIINNTKNMRALGGGIYCYSDTLSRKFAIIFNNTIIYNKALSNAQAGGYGGGIDAKGTDVRIIDNNIEYNEVSGGERCYGPGVRLVYLTKKSILEHNTISFNNFSSGICQSGGLFLVGTNGVKILHNTFESNSGTNGGGINDLQSSKLLISNNSFLSNTAEQIGGGIYLYGSNSELSGNKIISNIATYGGGGIAYGNLSNSEIKNNLIAYNESADGGGIVIINNSNPQITNNTIVENKAATGGAISLGMNCDPIIMNTILYGNTADSSGNQVYLWDEECEPTFSYSNIEGGVADFGVYENAFPFPGTYENNIDSDPLFVEGDSLFHLSDGSLCIGGGIDSIEIAGMWYHSPIADYDGNVRPSPLGSNPDIGAMENPNGTPTAVEDEQNILPEDFHLSQNYPNPFNPSTTIKYQIPEDVKRETKNGFIPSGVEGINITLKVYDLLGREVATLINEKQKPGYYETAWDASGQPSGIYFYKLETSTGFAQTKKLILLK